MLKRIVLVMGETPASDVARDYAFALAESEGAQVLGVAGIDLEFIEAPTGGALGADAYKQHMESTLKAQAREAADRLRGRYMVDCRQRQLPFEWLDFEGNPLDALKLAAESSDLLVTGHDVAFRGKLREQLSETLAGLCHMTPRPVIVCGEHDRIARRTLIAYDGGLPSMRALQMFALLELWRGRDVHLVAVADTRAAAERLVDGASRYLEGRECAVGATAIASRVHPTEVLKIEIADRGIGTLVMGAYGHRRLRDRLFGSTTRALLEAPPCALFLYH